MTKTEEAPKPAKLSPADPVPAEVLVKFNELQGARQGIALELLGLEQERIRLLGMVHKVDTQEQRLFESVLMERGLPPTTQVELDSKTGLLRVLTPTPVELSKLTTEKPAPEK